MKKYEYEPVGTIPKVGDRIEMVIPSPESTHRVGDVETVSEVELDIWDSDAGCWLKRHFETGVYRVLKRKSSRVRKPKVKRIKSHPPVNAETILEEAGRLTSGDRNADYGHPLDDYSKTGMIWGALLHAWSIESAKSKTPIPVPPELACLCMTGVKLSREVNKSKRDNLVDGAGYLRLVEMIQDEREKREGK